MIAVEILTKETSLGGILDQLQVNRPVWIERTWEQVVGGGLVRGELRQRGAACSQRRGSEPGQPPTAVQFPQEQIALAAFEPSVGTAPLEQFTNGRRQFGPGEIGELACDPADHGEFRFGQSMTAERQTLTDCDWHRKQPAPCRSSRLRYWNPRRKSSEIFAGKFEMYKLQTAENAARWNTKKSVESSGKGVRASGCSVCW